jgi:NAD(P)-dependent dehydrogenase (short-subunit alcohol dehydrogenase family)
VIPVRTDVTREADTKQAVALAIKEFGKVDILVNDAGVEGAMVKLPQLTEEQWSRVNDVNVKGTYLMTKAVIPHMVAANYGKIVNFSSFYGREGFGDDCEYCASKFAVVGITQALAKEYAEHGINVNAVCPGIVRTPMWERVLDILVERTGNPNREEIWEHWVGTIPLKRAQKTQDIANVVIFLSSDLAQNITGESININGGLRMD